MLPLTICLLGTPTVEVGGEPLVVDTRKATALLAFLVVTGHPQSRAVIADLLWPGLDGERAGGALRRTLSALRAGLGEGRLITDRNTVSLAPAGTWFDLAEARAIAADPDADLSQLQRAVELHRGELLAGFALRDSIRFEDWLRDLQDEVGRERAALLDRLADALAAAGRHDEAVGRARERLGLDPLHEPTHRRLIDLYARAGRRGDAMSQYRECVRVLDRELGVMPLAETTELYDAISAGAAPAGAAPAPAESVAELAMVGRDRELERLLTLADGAREQGAVAVIEGESGVGKTRLAREALARLVGAETVVVEARPAAGEQGLAYGVIATLLQGTIAQREAELPESLRGEAARLLPELGSAPLAALSEPGAQLRFLEAIASILGHTGAGRSRILFVDDLQWTDPASLDALAYLARRIEHRGLLLLCALRTDEPDPERRCARLAGLGSRIALRRLGKDDVLALAALAGLDPEQSERVYRDSEGLPLLLSEMISAPQRGVGVRALFESRLDAAGEVASQVLSAAAVIGRRFEANDVRLVSGRSEEEVAAALEELTMRGLVTEVPDGYDFSHEILRGIAEERISRARRRLLHGRAAQALQARRAEHAIVARHLELAGDDRAAASAYAAAGDRARELSAQAEAIAHYEAALALGYGEPAILHESIGDVQTLRGEYELALGAYNAAAALAESSAASRLEHKLGAVHERRGDWALAERHYLEALAVGALDEAERATILADRSRVAWRRGDLDEARAVGFEALALADRAGARAAAARANNLLGLLGCGREYLERSLELSAGLQDPSVRIAALNNLALDHAAAGELELAESLTREALELCRALGDRHREAALRNNLADLLHRSGRADGAMEELKVAVAALAAIGSDGEVLYPGVWDLVEW